MTLKLSLACWVYDRTRPIMDGRVKVEGVEISYLPLWVQETFARMLRHREFDVSEMSFGGYVQSLGLKEKPFVAIPVFPSRMFRHRSIYVNVESGVKEPRDLVGKKVGVPEYRQTAVVWIKGILADYYNLPVDSVTYYTGQLEREGFDLSGTEDVDKYRLKGVKVEHVGKERSLSEMLEVGEIQALYSARAPSPFLRGSGKVVRLFPNYPEEERKYFKASGVFPIMHIMVIRRDVYESNRWLALSLYKAFSKAKELAYRELEETGVLKYMLPWLHHHLEETREVMGRDYWPYGVKANYQTIDSFLRYCYQQGVADRLYKPEEIFAEETLEDLPKDDFAPSFW